LFICPSHHPICRQKPCWTLSNQCLALPLIFQHCQPLTQRSWNTESPQSKGWSFKEQSIFQLAGKIRLRFAYSKQTQGLAPEEKEVPPVSVSYWGKIWLRYYWKAWRVSLCCSAFNCRAIGDIGFYCHAIKRWIPPLFMTVVQESIVSGIPSDDRFAYYETLGKFTCIRQKRKESIFNAAECYLKARTWQKAMEICYQSGSLCFR